MTTQVKLDIHINMARKRTTKKETPSIVDAWAKQLGKVDKYVNDFYLYQLLPARGNLEYVVAGKQSGNHGPTTYAIWPSDEHGKILTIVPLVKGGDSVVDLFKQLGYHHS